MTKDDTKHDFQYQPRAQEFGSPSSSCSSLAGRNHESEKYPVMKDEEAMTGQVMDSMDMMFAVMSNAMQGEINEVKITLSKSADNELHMKVKSSQAGPPLDITLQRPMTDDNTWMRHSMETLHQQIRELQNEITALKTQARRQVIAGYTPTGIGRWLRAPESRFPFRPVLETVVDLSQFNLAAPPTTVMAQLFETKYGQVVGTGYPCAVSEITATSFRVKVKKGGLKRAHKRNWHIYFLCAY
eukprot:Phypoly_transcript_05884.p1 GENE.Phypoly_transcript_05884~~Phypoly_transcript_05884.p1  ORF type:complete len:278 (+),score=34.19 Phypoly_transcript_05884:111-836(+)